MEAAPFFQRKHWDATFELGSSMLLGAAKTSAPRRKRS
jgi:hypothetical protein